MPSVLVTSPVRSQRLVVCGGSSLAKDGQIGYH